MEAFMLELDLASVTQAQANRDSAMFPPFGSWSLETGGGSKVPEDWLQYWPSRAIAPPSGTKPTAWINAAGYSVCPEVMDVIDSLAPGIHQFVPFELETGPKGLRKKYPYFSIHVADRADDVIVDKSNVRWIESQHGTYWSKDYDHPLALPAASIMGKHIWWNRRCNILLISGELHNRLVQQGLMSGLKFQKQIVE
jgi:hypothetical protein